MRLLLSGLISHAEADRPMHVNDVLQLAGFWGDLLSAIDHEAKPVLGFNLCVHGVPGVDSLMERLQKILSQAGIASRRASEQLMLDGRVTRERHDGPRARHQGRPGPRRHPRRRPRIKIAERHRYILLNKPRGYVTTRSDPERRPTVIDLLRGVKEYVYPVGRLDYDSEGLLLLTNDGDLAARLTHPSHGVARVYEARVLGIPDDARSGSAAARHRDRRPAHARGRGRDAADEARRRRARRW